MEQDWKFWTILVLSSIVLTISLIYLTFKFDINKTPSYKMPTGAVCKIYYVVSAGFGGSGIEFKRCNDGKIYINPETYEVITK